MNFTCVEVEEFTGRILASSNIPWDIIDTHKPMVPGAILKWLDAGIAMPDLRRDYFDFADQTFKPRSAMPITVTKKGISADDADEAVISGIPEEALLFLDGEPAEGFTGETLEFTSPMPATYRIRLERWPFLPFETEIVAT